MRKYLIAAILIILIPGFVYADEFLKVPVLPNSQVVSKNKDKLVLKTGLSHDEVLAYYREELKNFKDVKYRDWKDSTYIEDDSNQPWHSITLSKENGQKETTVEIAGDAWTWIISTLILRFFGVFTVLLILYVGMKISGIIISSSIKAATR